MSRDVQSMPRIDFGGVRRVGLNKLKNGSEVLPYFQREYQRVMQSDMASGGESLGKKQGGKSWTKLRLSY